MSNRRKSRGPLSEEEIRRAFAESSSTEFGPVLSPEQLAKLIGVGRSTVYFWIKSGRFDGAVRKRGKHLFVWRDRAIADLFRGSDWK